MLSVALDIATVANDFDDAVGGKFAVRLFADHGKICRMDGEDFRHRTVAGAINAVTLSAVLAK
ncbi:MAG TPA: hypothetical protein VIF39_15260 [Hyphomicrobium sp.]